MGFLQRFLRHYRAVKKYFLISSSTKQFQIFKRKTTYNKGNLSNTILFFFCFCFFGVFSENFTLLFFNVQSNLISSQLTQPASKALAANELANVQTCIFVQFPCQLAWQCLFTCLRQICRGVYLFLVFLAQNQLIFILPICLNWQKRACCWGKLCSSVTVMSVRNVNTAVYQCSGAAVQGWHDTKPSDFDTNTNCRGSRYQNNTLSKINQ